MKQFKELKDFNMGEFSKGVLNMGEFNINIKKFNTYDSYDEDFYTYKLIAVFGYTIHPEKIPPCESSKLCNRFSLQLTCKVM